jgi:AhpD family alkylhydroperoxidase
METETVKQFREERKNLNNIVMKYSSDKIKKFYSLDAHVYQEGALSKKTKELLGLIASLVLRCDDCITYHLMQCYEHGITNEELEEACAIGVVVGGSVTIPHLRRVFKTWDELHTPVQ